MIFEYFFYLIQRLQHVTDERYAAKHVLIAVSVCFLNITFKLE